jgi:hypothetical protein
MTTVWGVPGVPGVPGGLASAVARARGQGVPGVPGVPGVCLFKPKVRVGCSLTLPRFIRALARHTRHTRRSRCGTAITCIDFFASHPAHPLSLSCGGLAPVAHANGNPWPPGTPRAHPPTATTAHQRRKRSSMTLGSLVRCNLDARLAPSHRASISGNRNHRFNLYAYRYKNPNERKKRE